MLAEGRREILMNVLRSWEIVTRASVEIAGETIWFNVLVLRK